MKTITIMTDPVEETVFFRGTTDELIGALKKEGFSEKDLKEAFKIHNYFRLPDGSKTYIVVKENISEEEFRKNILNHSNLEQLVLGALYN